MPAPGGENTLSFTAALPEFQPWLLRCWCKYSVPPTPRYERWRLLSRLVGEWATGGGGRSRRVGLTAVWQVQSSRTRQACMVGLVWFPVAVPRARTNSPSETQEFGCLGPLHEPQLSAASRCNFPLEFPSPPLAFLPFGMIP